MKKRMLSLVVIVALVVTSFTLAPVKPVSASEVKALTDDSASSAEALLMSDAMFIRQNKGVQTGSFMVVDGRTSANDIRRLSFIKFNLADYQKAPESIGQILLRYYVDSIPTGNAGNKLYFYVLPQNLEDKWSNSMTYEQADAAGLVSYTNGDTPDAAQPIGAVGSVQYTTDLGGAIKSHLEANPGDSTVIIKIDAKPGGENFVATIGKNTATDDQKPALMISLADGYETFVPVINELKDGIGAYVSEDIALPASVGDINISWRSNNPDVIDDSGAIVGRPGLNEPDKQASYSVTLSADGKEITFTDHFTVLHTGSYAGKVTDLEDRAMEMSFHTAASPPEAAGYLLELPNSYFIPDREYTLHTPAEVKDGTVRFTPSKDAAYTLVNVSGLSVGGEVPFTIEAQDALISASDEVPILRGIDSGLKQLADTADNLIADDTHAITDDISLPASKDGASITWSSSNPGVISNTGSVNRPYMDQGDAVVELTADLSGGGKTYSQTYVVTVLQRTGTNEFTPLQDPDRMTDESFFGVWSSAGEGGWSVQPILQYDEFGGLNDVLNSVKEGDYAKAKENLLAYYRTRTGVPEYDGLPAGSGNPLLADMTVDKILSFNELDSPVGTAMVTTDWNYYTVPLSELNSAYFLMDSDMDGSTVQVMSKENPANKPPILEVTVDGETKTFTAVADTSISAGDAKNTNYGQQPILNVREAASAPDLPFGSLTSRTYFRFPTEDIVGNVTSIKLKFYARSTAGTKKLYVLRTNNQKEFDENTFTWAGHYPEAFNFKETGYIWLTPSEFKSKWGVETEWPNYVTRLYPLQWLVSSYLTTHDELYAYRAFELLVSMYAGSDTAVYSRILEAGWRTEYIDDLFFGGMNSGGMTPEVLTAMLKYMYANAAALKDATPDAGANWQSAIRVGFMRLNAYTPEIEPASWWEHGKARLQDLYSSGIFNADGSYVESTTGYIIGVINELKLAMKLILTRDDENDPTYRFLLEQYQKLAKYYFDLTMNEGHQVPWGDGTWNDIKQFAKNENEYDPNPNFEYFATDGRSGVEPNYTSILYPGKAVAIMRDNWLPGGFSAFINADSGGNHSHADDLALDVYGFGRRLLVEVGGSSYSPGSLMAENRLKTISHNTIEIDNADQYRNVTTNVPQKIDLATNRLFDFVDANSSQIYNKAFNKSINANFDVNRKVLFLHHSFWIVSDSITPDDSNPHTYKQAWHPDAKNGMTIDPDTKTMATHYESGGANIAVVPADPETLDAIDAQNYMNNPETGITLSDYVQYNREAVTGPQTFDTVLYPYETAEAPDVAVARIPLDTATITATALQIGMGRNTGYYYSSNEPVPSLRDFGNYATDGQMAYVEKDGNGHIVTAALTKGTTLSDGDTVLVSGGETLGDLGVQWNADNSLALYSSSDLPASGVQIYSATPIDSVVLNGKAVMFTYFNNIVSTTGIDAHLLTYNGNGDDGTGTVPSVVTAVYGTDVTVSGNTGNLVKEGYSFAGWNTAADGSGTSYAAGSSFTIPAADTTLYAQWLSGNALLGGLSVSEGSLDFSPAVVNYTVNVAPSVSSIDLSVAPGDPAQSISVTGAVYQSVIGSVYNYRATDLAIGVNPIQVHVTAQDNSTNTYTINVARAEASEQQFVLDPDHRTLTLLGGATIALPDDLEIPAGATLTVSLSDEAPSGEAKLNKAGQVLAFAFEGIAIDRPVDITLGYAEGQDTSKLAIYYYNESTGKWEYTPSVVTDSGVKASVNHFSTYGVLSDTVAPDRVSAALDSASDNSVTLKLAANDDSGIAEYLIYRDGELIGETGQSTYLDTGLASSHTYHYQVIAVDRLGNRSDFSAELAARTEAGSGDNSGPSGPSTGDNGGAPGSDPTESSLPVVIDGKEHPSIATATASQQDGQTVLTAKVDAAKLSELLAQSGDHPAVTIPVAADADQVTAVLAGDALQALADRSAILEVQTPNGSYKLPASEALDRLSEQMGAGTDWQNIIVSIDIAKSNSSKAELLANAGNNGGFSVVVPPVDFTVTAALGDRTVTLDTFNSFVEREIPIPAGVDASGITTAVVLNEDGTVRSVPTKIVTRDGAAYAVINSLTNSTYALVANSVTFKDVENHWSRDAVNDMGSRMIIGGVGGGMFNPDQDITRAEFAAIIVRGLGLPLEDGASEFSDVKATDWFGGAVATARKYGLINGFEDGTFRPNDPITREQAMVMIAKAMDYAQLAGTAPEQTADSVLHAFADADAVSSWAKSAVADSVQAGIVSGRGSNDLAPHEFMTRAEVAAIMERLLQKSELI